MPSETKIILTGEPDGPRSTANPSDLPYRSGKPRARRGGRLRVSSLFLALLFSFHALAHASILSALLSSQGSHRFLPAAQAYRLRAMRLSHGHVVLTWHIASGYYLYQDKIRIQLLLPSTASISYRLPPAQERREPQGWVDVYYHTLTVPVKVHVNGNEPLRLRVDYQGCAIRGLCYPPISRVLTLTQTSKTAPRGGLTRLLSSSSTHRRTQSQAYSSAELGVAPPSSAQGGHLLLLILAFFVAGIALAFTPCGAPMIPILLTTLGRVGHGRRRDRLWAASVYVLSVALTYGLLGLLAAAVGHDLIPFFETPWVIGLFAGLFVLYGTAMLTDLRIELPSVLRERLAAAPGEPGGRVLWPLVFGVSSALLASPCLTPAVAAGLTLAIYRGAVWQGALLLFVLGLGLGLPLMAAALVTNVFWPRGGPWLVAVERFLGFALYGLAIWFAARVLPAPLVALLVGALFALLAAFLSPSSNRDEVRTSSLFRRGFSWLCAMIALGEVLGALSGAHNVLNPLRPVFVKDLTTTSRPSPRQGIETTIRTPRGLARALARARREGEPALIDYDARWCVSCVLMDKTVFTNPRVQQALRSIVFIRADVTRDDHASEELLTLYHVLGPPTFLYFAHPDGHLHQRPTARLVGARGVHGFLDWLRNLARHSGPSRNRTDHAGQQKAD